MKEMKKVFSSWSGGKDSSLARYKAMGDGFEVTYLLNLLSEDGKRERAHGTRPFLLQLQSEAMGIPIVHVNASWGEYESKFKHKFHLSGESGEYHTFVTDGPIFKRRIKVSDFEQVYVEGTWVLDIKAGELE